MPLTMLGTSVYVPSFDKLSSTKKYYYFHSYVPEYYFWK